ncbi:MAG: MbtH family NRPS accessory protein [Actinobacteria bacterium]|nr:MbtH family NRPS accessory protein [Actinomycetota bacterium]
MNPFDDDSLQFLVLANEEGQHALWPEPFAVSAGWEVRHGPASRSACLDFVRDNWTDLRPRSLRAPSS